jgi:hypothetical protein
MRRFGVQIIILVFVTGLLYACQPSYKDPAQPIDLANKSIKTNSCPALPITFKESDLSGTWTASYSLNDKDILIIKDGGTYKQIYDSPDANIHYESGWLNWWIEYRESGYVRLHLQGMRRADEPEVIFNREGGGIDPEMIWTIDYCENQVIEMPDEIVLIVTGAKYKTPRGIILRQTRLAGAEFTNSFSFKGDPAP